MQITGDVSGQLLGSSFGSLIDNAKKHKKDLGDDFLSVEHLILSFYKDKRFGHQLLKNLQISEEQLNNAVLDVRGNQRVTDQSKCTLVSQ